VSATSEKNTLSFQPTDCKLTKAPTTALYATGKTLDGERRIILRLPYGRGIRIDSFVEP
jgi:hypothetical protein